MAKIVIVYLSTSGNTKAMADAIAEGILSRNVSATTVNFHEARMEEIKAADAIAKPLPVAAVVFPSESRASVRLRTSGPRWLISAFPPALSAMGP